MDAAGQRRCDRLIDKVLVALAVVGTLLFVVACTVLLVRVTTVGVHVTKHRDDRIRTGTSTGTASVPQPRGDTVMPVGPGGAGAVEEGKGFYAGRPIFKVPPSSPCRAKAVRC